MKDFIETSRIIEGDPFIVIRGELERHFSESNTTVILIDTVGTSSSDDMVGYGIYRYSEKPVYGKELIPELIKTIGFDDIYCYGVDHGLKEEISWDRPCINSYLEEYCCKDKIFITIDALNKIENLPSNCY